MSRILFNTSNAVFQRAATAANISASSIATTAETTTSRGHSAIASNRTAHRWKSLMCHMSQKHHCRTTAAINQLTNFAAISSTSSLNVRTTTSFSGSGLIENKNTNISRVTTNPNSKMMATATADKCLNLDNINPNFIVMEYAVRGPIVIRAAEIEQELKKGAKKPFDYVIRANIGDCHAMGQKPIHYLRQLLTLTFNPDLLDSPQFPDDVKEHARIVLDGCPGGSVGSYTDSSGLEVVRRQVAEFIEKRDGLPCDFREVFLTAGASPGIKSVLSLIRRDTDGKKVGVMVPIPQYPLYSATLAEYGMDKIDYYLDEEKGWSLNRQELQRAYDEAKSRCHPRAIVIINPGNPTGQVLTRQNIEEIIKFAHDNRLFILADEVYQDNIYDKDSKFFSFKKVLIEMGAPYKDMELASFMSTSKGFLGECGIRGGYMEIINMCPKVMAMLTKSITASLCSTTAGQVAVSAYVRPPKPGGASYDTYMCERNGILESLKQRAKLVHETLSRFEGFKVNPVQGAMYVFPQIIMPPKAIEAAKAKNIPADVLYAFELLESTGICVVAGSGFGQTPGTYHFRSTILPQPAVMKDMMNKFQKFHLEFMKKYK